MNNTILKTTTFRDHPGCKVVLEEMQNGQKHIRKLHAKVDEEWDAMCFLHNAGFNVPKPYKIDEQGMYMQYLDNGILWDSYQIADAATQKELINKFTKLLYDLHNIVPKSAPTHSSFVQNELFEIKNIMERKQLDKYLEIHNKLALLSTKIKENTSCYVHRDYHVWNVLLDNSQKAYLIDMELTQGDYRFDVGWTYMLQNRSAVHDIRHGEIAKAFLSGYYKLKPEACDDIDFFMQLANLRWLVNVAPDKNIDNHWFPEMMAIAEQDIKNYLT
ncbi:MAG: aminoglycoside phosphotransferase family protein [Defluviitaleaceae bacterium]|nr:aminoglycoside phosphotransferase family protein [Defluviitaleaceae bacterium]